MNFIRGNKNRLSLLLISILLVSISFYLYSCGGGGYSDPTVEATSTSVLISPETLNGWITKGYGTDQYGYTKVVVFDVTSQAAYIKGHVPGAYLMDSNTDVSATRSDGVSDTVSDVATKAIMDNVIQRTGVDEKTVIVFTTDSGAGNLMALGRAYFNFRYWGFPKERLRVLDGFNDTYSKAGFTLDTTVPSAPPASTYSVCQLQTQSDRFRAPLAEMITVAEDNDPKTVVLDARSPNEYNGVAGSTAGPTGASGGYVAFEGHVRTAVSQNYTTLLGSDGRLLPKNDLISLFNAAGASSSTMSYSYCRTSYRAAITFLALDGVLGWPAKIYDGAWIEWGQMADQTEDGALATDSPWRTDLASRSEAITYNKEAGKLVYKLTGANSYALRADMVNVTDSSICGGGTSAPGGSLVAPGY
ncbi:MAG: selenite/tellurite reduction operon rhodanese-like protein ExtH [Nitrospiraceae bacterium]|nr:selenite/tellurite reduction operon rhodanese-like protein ExtH [Nitrospiraceae bacterium]